MSTLGKTPIEFLHEVCTKKGITPLYELLNTEGQVHNPNFHYRCSAGEISGHGQGKQKKIAKHEAAQEVIKLMFCQNGAGDKTGLGNMPTLNKEGMAGNPIGQLQELTQKNKWAPPNYEFLNSGDGTVHHHPKAHKEFKCVCSLGKQWEKTATGRSKRTAKRNAAAAMLQFLKQNAGITSDDMNKETLDSIAAHMCKLSLEQANGFGVSTITSKASEEIRQFYDNLKSSSGQWLMQLHNSPLSKAGECLNYCQFLQQIADEQRFEVTYVDIHEPTVQGLPQCLVQLSTMPVAVCHGTGTTPDSSHAAAALNALQYLKIMTKKAT